jgi:hypothetical protein
MATRTAVVHEARVPLVKSSDVIAAAETLDPGIAPTATVETAIDTPMRSAEDFRNI